MEPERVAEDDAGQDRLGVHAVWEAVLLICLGVAAALVWSRSTAALSGIQLRGQLVAAAVAVLLASAFAVSLRAAVPNLAVGGTAVGVGVLTAYLQDRQDLRLGVACAIAVGAAAAAGLVLGLLVVGLRAPGWAVTVAGSVLLSGAVVALTDGQSLIVTDGPDLQRWAWALYGGASLLSIAGGAFALSPNVRAAISRYRTDRDPAISRGTPAGTAVVAALVVSSLLAAAAGLIVLLRQRAATPGEGLTSVSSLTAFAAALLGGVSVHGRRGGVFGTVLAASTLQLVLLWLALGNVAGWIQVLVVGGAGVLGLGVSRLIEWLSPPRPPAATVTVPIPDDDPYPSRYADLYQGDQVQPDQYQRDQYQRDQYQRDQY